MVSFQVNTLSVIHCYTLLSYANPVWLDLRNHHILHMMLSVKRGYTFYTIPIGKHIDLLALHKAPFCTLAYTIGIIFLVPIKIIIY